MECVRGRTDAWPNSAALRRLMKDRATVAAVARELGVSWDTVITIAMDATRMTVANDTWRLDGVRSEDGGR
jgi:hypothetical protein